MDEKLIIALVVVALFLLVWREGFEDEDEEVPLYTSGATMRRLAQMFSSSNQEQFLTISDYNGRTHLPLRATLAGRECMLSNKDIDGYIGSAMGGIYTSGATLRRLAQIFTSTNQDLITIYSIDNPHGPSLKLIARRA